MSTREAERLIQYLRTFRFEPGAGDAETARPNLMIDLRVSPRGVEVATRAGDEDDLERRLADTYRMADSQNLDLRPPPHPPERMVLYRTSHPMQARVIPEGPGTMTIVWTDEGPTVTSACFGRCDDLLGVLEVSACAAMPFASKEAPKTCGSTPTS